MFCERKKDRMQIQRKKERERERETEKESKSLLCVFERLISIRMMAMMIVFTFLISDKVTSMDSKLSTASSITPT